jgi:hypothetical protein
VIFTSSRQERAVSQLLHRADHRWVDLTDRILERVHRGRPVLWVGLSGALQLFAAADGVLTRTRQAPDGAQQLGDGWPLIVQPPLFATACGCGDGSGYRSTRPLLVAALTSADDVSGLLEQARSVARQLLDAGYDLAAPPAGHPPQSCRALTCPLAPLSSSE